MSKAHNKRLKHRGLWPQDSQQVARRLGDSYVHKANPSLSSRMKYVIYYLIAVLGLAGCAAGHQDYVDFKNSLIGKKETRTEPFKWEDSGKLVRADYLVSGQGLTHITKDDNGNLIYHYSVQEVLITYPRKEWVGKCLTYNVVNPETMIIIDWGFDKGGNPLSCRTWP
jgi:hypothetical protein